jgi:hypothetical protein
MWVTIMAVPALKGTAELFEGDIFKPCKAIRSFLEMRIAAYDILAISGEQ